MNIKKFIAKWSNHGYEKGETHSFWLSFLRDVLNINEPENFIQFEVSVPQGFIDAFLPDTKVLIEQKSSTVNLDDTEIFRQAKRYNDALEWSRKARYIITCNFREFRIFDMDRRKPELSPTKILLAELPEKFHAFDFLIDETKQKLRIELELSLKAGEIVGKLYDALHAQYLNPDDEKSLASLNKLCVRLVFCLFAESSGIFGKHKIFRDWLEGSRNIRQDLILLFDVLNTPLDARDPYLDDTLKKFPFVNGGLFSGSIEIPNFTPEIKNLLLEEASSGFNWSGISPTIFGAVFESTLNPVTRRAGGMHYTAAENIHKVIDPLFLDDLKDELKKSNILDFSLRGSKRKNFLLQLQKKLSEIKIFDPACGSGNFLTESFISLRRIENQILKLLLGSQITLGELDNPVKVSINQFYGIEINDFAVSVAQTALWIAELQMIQETREIIHRDLDFLPLKSYSNIIEGNALTLDWQNLCPNPSYIIGNPPFVGFTYQTPAQKADLQKIFPKVKNLDYVACWFKKAADFMTDSTARAAFVSTNSITQGESVTRLWKNLFDAGNHIDFAHRTFTWDSESAQKAHVHCVVVGFSSAPNDKPKIIFDGDKKICAENINAYLLDADNILVESRNAHLQYGVSIINWGSKATDGGFLILSPEERDELIKREPYAEKFIHRYVGGNEFINNILRYVLWLVDVTPNELHKMKSVYERVKNVREFRLASKKAATRRDADIPWLFQERRQPTKNYLLIPHTSSERRKYIPIGFLTPDIIANAQSFVIPDATLYHFGVLTSSIHMTWLRTVGGRLKSDYRYSKDVVYNNFVWKNPTREQKNFIEQSAQAILTIREQFPDSTFAELYDEVSMPYELRRAHRENDLAVAKAYGWEKFLDDEPKIAVELLKLYDSLTKA